jgi:N-acetylmuramoyl-L-alanine amidase CwlA
MVTVRRPLDGPMSKTWGTHAGPTSITIHETANTGRGANAAAHQRLQAGGNVRQASWQWQVDDREAVQSFRHNVRCWHAGSAEGAQRSIAVEICVNADGDYLKALANAAALVILIRSEEGDLPIFDHHHWTGKDCPTRLRAGSHGLTWAGFDALTEEDDMPTAEEIAKAVWKERLFVLNANEAQALVSNSEGEVVSAGSILQRSLVLGDQGVRAALAAGQGRLDARELADLIPTSIAREVADLLAERLKG